MRPSRLILILVFFSLLTTSAYASIVEVDYFELLNEHGSNRRRMD